MQFVFNAVAKSLLNKHLQLTAGCINLRSSENLYFNLGFLAYPTPGGSPRRVGVLTRRGALTSERISSPSLIAPEQSKLLWSNDNTTLRW